MFNYDFLNLASSQPTFFKFQEKQQIKDLDFWILGKETGLKFWEIVIGKLPSLQYRDQPPFIYKDKEKAKKYIQSIYEYNEFFEKKFGFEYDFEVFAINFKQECPFLIFYNSKGENLGVYICWIAALENTLLKVANDLDEIFKVDSFEVFNNGVVNEIRINSFFKEFENIVKDNKFIFATSYNGGFTKLDYWIDAMTACLQFSKLYLDLKIEIMPISNDSKIAKFEYRNKIVQIELNFNEDFQGLVLASTLNSILDSFDYYDEKYCSCHLQNLECFAIALVTDDELRELGKFGYL